MFMTIIIIIKNHISVTSQIWGVLWCVDILTVCVCVSMDLAQLISVGWGRKETQFHGSEGKSAATRKETVSIEL